MNTNYLGFELIAMPPVDIVSGKPVKIPNVGILTLTLVADKKDYLSPHYQEYRDLIEPIVTDTEVSEELHSQNVKKIKSLIREYAEKLSKIPEEKHEVFLLRLKKLIGELPRAIH